MYIPIMLSWGGVFRVDSKGIGNGGKIACIIVYTYIQGVGLW